MLTAEELLKGFRSNTSKTHESVLNKVNFQVGKGEIVSITGKSGEGKSTIARIVCGMIHPDSGRVLFNGQVLVDFKHSFPANLRKQIQLIPQQPMLALDPRQRIGDAIAEPLLYHGLAGSRMQAAKRVRELLKQVWLDPEFALRYPSQLSGGQAQRAVIARAIGLNPSLLIADEATSMLDVFAQAQVVQIFKMLVNEQRISVLLISHDKPLVQALSDHIYHLSDGILTKQL